MMKLGPAIIGGALLLSAALVLSLRTHEPSAEADRFAPAAHRAKAAAPRHRSESANAALAREIRALTIREIRDQLPAAPEFAILVSGSALESQRTRLILERFGALEGEAALDEIMSRYGTGTFTGQAMAIAIAGWMGTDSKGALAALRSMTATSGASQLLPIMNWKGESLISSFG